MNNLALRVLVVIAVVLGLAIGYKSCSQSRTIPNPFDKGSRAYEPFAAFAKRLAGNQALLAKINARIKNSADPKTVGFEIAESGMCRLDDAALEQRMVFALKLVDHLDLQTCAALARLDSERSRQLMPKILKAIEQLPVKDIEDYMALVERAIVAELDNVPMPTVSPSRAQSSMNRLAEKFSDAERALMARVVNYPSVTTDDTSCWVVKTVYGEILSLPAKDRQTLARVFSAPQK